MLKKATTTPPVFMGKQETASPGSFAAPRHEQPASPGPWLAALIIIGLIIISIVSSITVDWLKTIQIPTNASATPPQITTFNVQRTVSYADLNFTVLNAQYATSFADDDIQPGPAMVRVNMRVSNKNSDAISIIYYDVARLLVPRQPPVPPTNVHLSAAARPGTNESGWIDFPVARGIHLASLQLQLGSAALNETLVTVPFSGPFDASRYANRWSPQTLTIYYNFEGNVLLYHLKSVDVRYSYRGTEVRAGQQFYVLNLAVDNNKGVDVNPGFGFDYIRLVIDGNNRPPIDNTLPYGFKAGAQGVGGRVAYVAPAGLKTLTIAFLWQVVQGQSNYEVTL